MKKILFFTSDYSIGLSSLLVDELLALSKTNLDIVAVAGDTEQEEGLTQRLSSHNINIIRIKDLDKHQNFIALAQMLKKLILMNKIECIHVQNNWQICLIAYVKYVLLHRFDLKVIYTIHAFRNNNPYKAVLGRLIIGTLLFLFADRVVCMSSYLVRNFWLLKYKICQIPLGISEDYFLNDYPKLPENGLQLIFPAQFREGKNQDVIIRAFSQHISNTHDRVSCLILPGSGERQLQMIKLAEDLGIKDRVLFPGRVDKSVIKQMYLDSNIAVIASNSETFGQSIVEPFVLGRCVISTHVGIADNIIKHKDNGFFYNSEEELTSIFDYLYHNPNFIKVAGQKNYDNKMQFHWTRIAKLYLKMIQTL